METEIESFEQNNGQIKNIIFRGHSRTSIKAVYAKPPFEQRCKIPLHLGCELTEQGYLKADMFQKTTVPGVYACGDNTVLMRSVATAVSSGSLAGAMSNKEIIEEEF